MAASFLHVAPVSMCTLMGSCTFLLPAQCDLNSSLVGESTRKQYEEDLAFVLQTVASLALQGDPFLECLLTLAFRQADLAPDLLLEVLQRIFSLLLLEVSTVTSLTGRPSKSAEHVVGSKQLYDRFLGGHMDPENPEKDALRQHGMDFVGIVLEQLPRAGVFCSLLGVCCPPPDHALGFFSCFVVCCTDP